MDYKEKYNVCLFKFQVTDNRFYFLFHGDVPTGGFSSLYYISSEDKEAMDKSNITAQFKGTVWSPNLILDFDNFQEGETAAARLQELGLTYSQYLSGNKGYHFYIPRPHIPSHLLPKIDKEWVETNFPTADLSIYTHLHMFRLPGTVHEKTGIKKSLIYFNSGKELILPETLLKSTEEKVRLPLENNFGSLFLDSKVMNLTIPSSNGHRHDLLLRLAVILHKRGEEQSFIHRWLYHTSLLFTEPTPQEEIDKIVEFIGGINE